MKRLPLKLLIALLTFGVGLAAASVWLTRYRPVPTELEDQSLDVKQAKEIIQNSEAFNYPKEEILLLSTPYRPTIENADEPLYSILKDMGMLEITRVGKHAFEVRLTKKGNERNWLYGDNDWDHLPEARLVPIANRELSIINSIKFQNKGTAEVRFIWHWEANELGEKLKMDMSPHECVIEVKRCGSSWCVPYQDASSRLGLSEGMPTNWFYSTEPSNNRLHPTAR